MQLENYRGYALTRKKNTSKERDLDVKGTVMIGYGVLKGILYRWRLVTCISVIGIYYASSYVRSPLHARSLLPEKQYQVTGDYAVVTRYHDAVNKSVVEHIVFNVPKTDASSEKIVRRGVLMRRPQAKATILMCHGFGCCKRDITVLRMLFPDYNIMSFDFRAHGEDREGQYCTLGKYEMLDVKAATHVLKTYDKTKDLPVIAYAFSMGAVSAIEAQASDSTLFKAMILDCPFDSVEKLLRRGLENLKISVFGYEVPLPGRTLLEKCAFNQYTQPIVQAILRFVSVLDAQNLKVLAYQVHPEQSVKKVKIPCLFIHCKNDEKVPVESIKSVYDNAATEYKQLWITGGRRHFDSFFHEPERYVRKVQRFVNKVIVNAYDQLPKGRITDDSDYPRAEVF